MKLRYIGYTIFGLAFFSFAFYPFGIMQTDNAIKEFKIDYFNATFKDRRSVFEEHIDKLGAATMLDILESEFPLCHGEAHDLGKTILATTNDFQESIQACRNRCTSGCFHGVLMETFKDATLSKEAEFTHEHGEAENDDHLHIELTDIKDKIDEICNDPRVSDVHKIGTCVHGMGHALTLLSNYDMQGALDLCKVFEGKSLEYYCTGGVFMERDIVLGASDLEDGFSHYPCDEFTEFPATCYRYKVQRLSRSLGTTKAMAEECMNLDGFMRWGCFHGIGLTNYKVLEKDPGLILNICQHGSLDDQIICIDSAVEKLANFDQPQAFKVCTYLGGDLKTACKNAAELKLYSLDKDFSLYFQE